MIGYVQQQFASQVMMSDEVMADAKLDPLGYARGVLQLQVARELAVWHAVPVPDTEELVTEPWSERWERQEVGWRKLLRRLGLRRPRYTVISGVRVRLTIRAWVPKEVAT